MQVKVLVQHNSGAPATLMLLDNDLSLKLVRTQLTDGGLMNAQDSFLFGGSSAKVASSAEDTFTLKDVLSLDPNAAGGESSVFVLYIGQTQGEKISEDLTEYHKWENLSLAQQRQVLAVSYAARGFSLKDKEGLVRSFKDLYTLNGAPLSTDLGANTLMQSDYAFSKVARDLKLNFSTKIALDLQVPFFDAQAEYKHQHEHSSSSVASDEYLLCKLLVLKAKLKLERSQLKVNPLFVKAAFAAIQEKDLARRMSKLLAVLDEWGFYVPVCFTLGGMMYSSEQTQVREFKEAASEQDAFSATIKSKFVGGGFDVDTGSSQSSEQSAKYKNSMIVQIGGTEGSSINADVFATSLENPLQWKIIDTAEVLPTLVLLNNHGVDEIPSYLGTMCTDLINEHYNLPVAFNMEPCINLHAYATHVQRLL